MNQYERAALFMISGYEGLKAAGHDTDEMLIYAAKEYKNVFFGVPDVDTGLCSATAFNNHLDKKSHLNTHDHYNSRTKSSIEFMNHWRAGRFRMDRLSRCAAWIKAKARVVTVTREENTRLIPIQNNEETKNLHFRKQYALLGIKDLYKKPDLRQKKIYIIDGIEYTSATAAAKAHGCTSVTVDKRCSQDIRGNFPTWKCTKKVYDYVYD